MKKITPIAKELIFHFVPKSAIIYWRIIIMCALSFSNTYFLYAQCTTYANAVPDMTLTPCTGTENRSGVAYNPSFKIYYSVNAGSAGYNIQTYGSTGTLLDTRAQGFDYRGLWWNLNTDQLEGNGYDSYGGSKQKLDVSNGYPLGKVIVFPGNFQPDDQSCGAYDYDKNVVFYYFDGRIYLYSRANGALIGSPFLHGIPVPLSYINSTSVIYTGCTGMEIGIYDYINLRVYLFSKANGNFAASIQLPANAPSRDRFAMAYSNNLFWLFNGTDTWYSYKLFSSISDVVAGNNTFNDKAWKTGKDFIPGNSLNENTTEKLSSSKSVSASSTSINLNSSNAITINPNPTKNILKLRLSSSDNAEGIIQITDLTGKIIINKIVGFKQGKNDVSISVNSLASGIYIIKVLEHNNLQTLRFMKE